MLDICLELNPFWEEKQERLERLQKENEDMHPILQALFSEIEGYDPGTVIAEINERSVGGQRVLGTVNDEFTRRTYTAYSTEVDHLNALINQMKQEDKPDQEIFEHVAELNAKCDLLKELFWFLVRKEISAVNEVVAVLLCQDWQVVESPRRVSSHTCGMVVIEL